MAGAGKVARLGRRAGAALLLIVAGVALVGAAGEILLRLWPGLIGREVLLEFDKRLRAGIADELGLPLKQARRCLAPSDRLDGGPELCLVAPDFVFRELADPADLEEGGVEAVRHDHRGFCNPPAAAARPSADVLFLGDSFTRCSYVLPEATFAARLGERLGIDAYNLGVPGVGPHEYLEVLQRFGLELRPRVVVLGLYEGNDLRDAARYTEHLARSAAPTAAAEQAANGLPSWRDALMTRSWFLNFVAGAVGVVAERWRRPAVDFHYDVLHRGHWRPMNVTNGDLDEPRTAARLARGEISPELWEMPLRRLAELGAERGFVPLIAYLPAAYTGFAPGVRFGDPAIGAAVAEMSRRQRVLLRELTERLGVALVDCTKAMQAVAPSAPLAYFPANVHLTAAGHELVAGCLMPGVQHALELAPAAAAVAQARETAR